LAIDSADNRTFTVRGEDIGATLDGVSHVHIPLTLHSVQLTTLNPGDELDPDYHLKPGKKGGQVHLFSRYTLAEYSRGLHHLPPKIIDYPRRISVPDPLLFRPG